MPAVNGVEVPDAGAGLLSCDIEYTMTRAREAVKNQLQLLGG